jgi:hypothetical protein
MLKRDKACSNSKKGDQSISTLLGGGDSNTMLLMHYKACSVFPDAALRYIASRTRTACR